MRSRVIASIRKFFDNNGYVEVETPIRIPTPAPEEHIDALPAGDMFLHTSPELYMKRLLAAGYERIYQIVKCFRKEECGKMHTPEFTMLEWYAANDDYKEMMKQTESLITFAANETSSGDLIFYRGISISIAKPWERLSVTAAFEKFASISMEEALVTEKFDEIMTLEIEPSLDSTKPVFLYDYPIEKGSLAKKNVEHPELAERFELYIGGIELCNGFSELNDKIEQRERFEQERKKRKKKAQSTTLCRKNFWRLWTICPMPQATLLALTGL